LVFQGRITTLKGNVISVKTPDDYPGTDGIHSQAVGLGPTYKVAVPHGHVLFPDGKRPDTRPLAIGEYVLVVLQCESGPAAPPGGNPATKELAHSALIVERLVGAEKFVGH